MRTDATAEDYVEGASFFYVSSPQMTITASKFVKGHLISKCLQFSKKTEHKKFDLRYHSSKVEFFRSFFGRIDNNKKTFRN